jgi:hypothetical protein
MYKEGNQETEIRGMIVQMSEIQRDGKLGTGFLKTAHATDWRILSPMIGLQTDLADDEREFL